MTDYMLKLRHTGTPNVGGGEGAMVGADVSYTLVTGQDQTLFQAMPEKNAEAETAIECEDGYVVRRLTPTECERLQGFPDGWTRIPYDKISKVRAKPTDEGAFIDRYDEETGEPVWRKRKVTHVPVEKCPDGPRYRALGNSMAVPVIKWLGERIEMVNELVKEIEHEHQS